MRPAWVLVPASVCLELEALTLEEGRGGGSKSEPRGQRLFLCLGACPGGTVPKGQAGLKGAISLEPGGLTSLSAPSWPGNKASSKFSPWSKPWRFTRPQFLWLGCHHRREWDEHPFCPRSERTPLGGRGFLHTVVFHSLVSLGLSKS